MLTELFFQPAGGSAFVQSSEICQGVAEFACLGDSLGLAVTVIINLGLAALNLYQRRQIEQQQRQGGYGAPPTALQFLNGHVPSVWDRNEQYQHRRLATKRDGLQSVFWSGDCFALPTGIGVPLLQLRRKQG